MGHPDESPPEPDGRPGDNQKLSPGGTRLRSSVLIKVVVALALALLISGTATSAIAARLTRSILENKARDLGHGQLSIVQEAYAERKRVLAGDLRNLAQTLNARGLFQPQNRPELIAELGRASENLGLDVLRVRDERGQELVPPAGAAEELADDGTPPEILSTDWSAGAGELHGQFSKLVLTKHGTYVQAISIGTLAGDERRTLVGGYAFADSFAYRLRRQIGDTGDVLLVADGRVVGSTLTDAPQRPPSPRGANLPTSPTLVKLSGTTRSVAYVLVGPPTDPEASAIGIVLSDPVAALNQSLARARLLTTVLLTAISLAIAWVLFRWLIRPLVRLARTAARIASGDLDARFDAATRDEVGMLSRVLERMRVELRSKLALVEQQATELRESSQRIVTAEDQERQRLARDLHDGIQQQLVVLRMQLALAEEAVPRVEPGVLAHFERLGSELDGVIERLREVTQNLYPSILVDRGLAAATRSYVGQLPLYARLTFAPEPFPRLAPQVENAAYFLLGEAVTNALKHAAASEISLSLRLVDQKLVVTIRDDGRGFATEEVERGGGLLHMGDRVRSFGGTLQIRSSPGMGTEVVATLPLPPADASSVEPPPLRAGGWA